MNAGDTLPRLLWRNAARWPARPAWRQKRLGIWQTTSWSAFAARTGEIARGLAAWGFGPGARLAVLGDNRPDLYAALLAAQALGGIGVPLDPETDQALLAVLLRACAPAVVLAETAEQAGWLRPLAPAAARVMAAEQGGL
ncbi:MAG: AMP-binding protein, partial [Acetobacteraceae bacterium]